MRLSNKALSKLLNAANKVRPFPWERQSESRVMDANYTEVADMFDPEIAALLERAPEVYAELLAARKVVAAAKGLAASQSSGEDLRRERALWAALDAYTRQTRGE